MMFIIGLDGAAKGTKNPRPLPAVGFCQIDRLTSPTGFVGYYDENQNGGLFYIIQHGCVYFIPICPRVKLESFLRSCS
jgi:hypothetical protein